MRRIAGFALLLALNSVTVLTQTSDAHLAGLVVDATESVIPGAVITVVDVERRIERRVTSNHAGYYRVPFLQPGTYRVLATKEGFRPAYHSGLILEVGQTSRLDFVLQVGVVTETVNILFEQPLLQSERAEVGQVIDNKRIVEMPLNGRNYLELAQFSVGILPARQFDRGARSGIDGGFTAIGLHAAQNNVLLDGNDNSSRTSGGPLGYEAQAVKPPVDAVNEFKVITNNNAAEHGYRTGATVVVSTKSGTNTFHGALYHFFRNDKLDGTNFFANRSGASKPSYNQNQFGGTIGGPIIHDRSFFFFSYQGTRIRLGESTTSTVPSRALRDGDTSAEPLNRRNIFDPLSTVGEGADAVRSPFPNNFVPQSRWDPVSRAVIALYPEPNIAGRENETNNYFHSASRSTDADQLDFRTDHSIGSAHRFFARYSVRNQHEVDPGPLPLPADGGEWTTTRLHGHNIAANLNTAIGSSWYNELRFGFTHFPTQFDIPYDSNLNTSLGIRGAPGDSFDDGLDHGWSRFAPVGYSIIGARSYWPNTNNLDNLLVADSVAAHAGRHTLKIGAEYRRGDIFREAQRFRRGLFKFNGEFTAERPNSSDSRAGTGNSMADFVLGFANSERIGNAQGENLIIPYWGLYVQDDWKASPRLTLNVGLRYELFLRPTFPGDQSVGRLLIPEVNGVAPSEERLDFPSGPNDSGASNDRNNFAPRLGIAYRLSQNMVVRLGAGIYYGEEDSLSTESAVFRSGPPGHVEIANTVPRTDPDIRVQDGFSPLITGAVPNNTAVYVTPDFRPNLYSAQWFVDLQRQLPGEMLLTVGYNGQSSTHLSVVRNINQPYTADATIPWQERKIRPFYNEVTLSENSLNSNYNAVTFKAEKRFGAGLTFLSSFTWAHNIDYSDENLFLNGSGRASSHELWRDRGSSSLDRRLAYVLSVIYELPFGDGRQYLQTGLAGKILGGWNVGSIFSSLSGQPLDHSYSVDNQNNGGRVRGDYVSDPNLSGAERTIDRWFDTGFVTASAPGVIGNAGRNIILSPGRTDWDFILTRDFRLPREGHRVQFRFESFNFTNTPHFGPPNTAIGTPDAGKITTADEPRRIQFGLKYVF